MPPPARPLPGRLHTDWPVSQGDGPLTPWGQWLCPNEEIPEDLSKASTTTPGARCGAAGTLDSVQPVAGSPGRAPPHRASRTRPSCEARGSRAPVRSGVHVRVLPAAGALRCGLHPLSAPAGQAPSSLTEPPLGQAGPPASRPGLAPSQSRWSVLISRLSLRCGPVSCQAQCLRHLTVSPGAGPCAARPPCTGGRLTRSRPGPPPGPLPPFLSDIVTPRPRRSEL